MKKLLCLIVTSNLFISCESVKEEAAEVKASPCSSAHIAAYNANLDQEQSRLTSLLGEDLFDSEGLIQSSSSEAELQGSTEDYSKRYGSTKCLAQNARTGASTNISHSNIAQVHDRSIKRKNALHSFIMGADEYQVFTRANRTQSYRVCLNKEIDLYKSAENIKVLIADVLGDPEAYDLSRWELETKNIIKKLRSFLMFNLDLVCTVPEAASISQDYLDALYLFELQKELVSLYQEIVNQNI